VKVLCVGSEPYLQRIAPDKKSGQAQIKLTEKQ